MSADSPTPLVIYVDVDDTLVRSIGAKRIPIPDAIAHVRALHAQGATLYLWSTGGAAYAQATAKDLGLSNCFTAFLPKPNVIVDDQAITEWRKLVRIHPNECSSWTLEQYRAALEK